MNVEHLHNAIRVGTIFNCNSIWLEKNDFARNKSIIYNQSVAKIYNLHERTIYSKVLVNIAVVIAAQTCQNNFWNGHQHIIIFLVRNVWQIQMRHFTCKSIKLNNIWAAFKVKLIPFVYKHLKTFNVHVISHRCNTYTHTHGIGIYTHISLYIPFWYNYLHI